MLSANFVTIAIILRFTAGLSYLVATWKGTVRPNPVTWLLWALTPFVAFAAQIQDGVGPQAWMTAAIGIGPLLIFLVALSRHTSWRIGTFDVLCGVCATAGVVLWQATTDPALAVMLSIVADALAGIPTVAKAYRAPRSEKTFPYWLTIAAFAVTLSTVRTWNFMTCAFFCYGVLINLTVAGVVSVRSAQLKAKQGEAGLPRPAEQARAVERTEPAAVHSAVRPATVLRLSDRSLPVAVPRARTAADDMRIEVLEARVAELERLLAMEPAARRLSPDRTLAASTMRDRWEGWEGSA